MKWKSIESRGSSYLEESSFGLRSRTDRIILAFRSICDAENLGYSLYKDEPFTPDVAVEQHRPKPWAQDRPGQPPDETLGADLANLIRFLNVTQQPASNYLNIFFLILLIIAIINIKTIRPDEW